MPQPSHEAASEWIEVNIPAPPEERTRLLLELVDPLVHDHLAGRIKTWFYFWEPALRLRIRWTDPDQAASTHAELAVSLDVRRQTARSRTGRKGAIA